MGKMMPEYSSSRVIRRYKDGEPVLSAKDIPYEADCIFNAGVVKFQGRYVMIFRDDHTPAGTGFDHCKLGIAYSGNGLDWKVEEKPFLTAEDFQDPEITRVYDPRLTVIEEKCYLCFAVDTKHGIRGGIAVTQDFDRIEVLSLSAPDNRNMVLFPEKINGRYARLERPFTVYSRGGKDRFDIWISFSNDLIYWGDTRLLLTVEDVPFANDKIGPGAPPVRTDQGWLTLFHAVELDETRGKNGWEPKWQKRYFAGIMLLDAENPSKVKALCREPLIAPETKWETQEGYRTNVIFPGGMILEEDGEVKIYYGASDTVECLALADVRELCDICTDKRI